MPRTIYLASPRGFCAGVKRAIAIVEETLKNHGTPVYVRHEIVHNKHVVGELKQQGVIFIEDLSEVEDKSRPVIISAHGAGRDVYQKAEALGLKLIDATCPLVEKVHKQIRKFAAEDRQIVIIGKQNHPEIVGTRGQLENPQSAVVINSPEEASALRIHEDKCIGVVNQTTLAVDDLSAIIEVIKQRCGNVASLQKNDICYATTHRQAAVKAVAEKAEAIIIIGSGNSSNSKQLQKTALTHGARQAWLIDDATELPWNEIDSYENIGISAGASAPDYLLDELLDALKKRYENLKIHDIIVAIENVEFKA